MGKLSRAAYAEREVLLEVLEELVAHAVGAHEGAGFGVALVVQLDLVFVRGWLVGVAEGTSVRRIVSARRAAGCAACAIWSTYCVWATRTSRVSSGIVSGGPLGYERGRRSCRLEVDDSHVKSGSRRSFFTSKSGSDTFESIIHWILLTFYFLPPDMLPYQ